jgi:hypothetical protein
VAAAWRLCGLIAPAFAIIAWGLVRHFGCLEARPAALAAMLTWTTLVGMPVAGLLADRVRSSNGCGMAEECYEHFFVVMGVPAGWLLAIVILYSWCLPGG